MIADALNVYIAKPPEPIEVPVTTEAPTTTTVPPTTTATQAEFILPEITTRLVVEATTTPATTTTTTPAPTELADFEVAKETVRIIEYTCISLWCMYVMSNQNVWS